MSSIYIWSKNSGPKSEAKIRVNRADENNRKGLEMTSLASFNFRHLVKTCAEISYFDIDLNDNTYHLFTETEGNGVF
jgi:hypothetical protein